MATDPCGDTGHESHGRERPDLAAQVQWFRKPSGQAAAPRHRLRERRSRQPLGRGSPRLVDERPTGDIGCSAGTQHEPCRAPLCV